MVREELLALKHRLSIEVEMQQQAARPPILNLPPRGLTARKPRGTCTNRMPQTHAHAHWAREKRSAACARLREGCGAETQRCVQAVHDAKGAFKSELEDRTRMLTRDVNAVRDAQREDQEDARRRHVRTRSLPLPCPARA